ncbi:uncharacterized protein LOC116778551 isoform X2 [Danaus plexippus]|uniref:Uncharacterized protein n=2 Tax=Danaus plexippus TaxID=13037 RepID=A0A212EZN2_DANPL|nr:uncharacterized protein LOC116778551 isoform X2 [Danaus plexippus]XP_032528475.1 uncharacterized protein LOC116778551 isoform X2 [Danaus plexippus]OWR46965.1 hypothetical protein KGM_214618 [Danaus plexippus plexippus]
MDYIRNMFANTAGFQVGTIIGTIREKYKTMLIVYKQKENRYLKKATIQGARTPVRRPLHYFLRMELLNRLEFEIDRLVHVLETTVPKATFKLPNFRRANRRTDYNMEDIKKYRDDFFKKLNITTKFKDEEDYMI